MTDPILREISEWLREHERLIQPLARNYALKAWALSLTGSPADERALIEAKEKYLAVYNNRDDFDRLKSWLPYARSLSDIDARQLNLIYQAYVPCQIPTEVLTDIVRRETHIETSFNTYRATFEGSRVTDNQLRDVLKDEVRMERRQRAWEASKEIAGHVAGPLLELVEIRNREARRLGYPDYYAMSMQLSELDETWLFRLFDRLEQRSEAAFGKMKSRLDAELKQRFNATGSPSYPWLYGDPFFQEFPATGASLAVDDLFKDKDIEGLTRRHFESIGLDIDDILERSDLYEREGKSQHAFCIDIDNQGDVRVLCNVRQDERWMSTMLHEFGHAVYDKYHDPELPFVLRAPAHIFTTEAVAMLNGRMSKNPHWLSRIAGSPVEQARAIGVAATEVLESEMLISMRWIITLVRFERELYRDPAQDLNSLWWSLVSRIQKVAPPPGRNKPDWAAKIHLTSSPVYYQNYLLGELMASQLLEHMRSMLPDGEFAGHPEIGRFLIERVFKPGRRFHWNELLRRATGEELNAEHFVRQFVAA